jgi:hypothetical protein
LGPALDPAHRKGSTRAFVGSYDCALRKGPDGAWTIHSFRFNLKFLEGNLELEKG